ncbi:MAG: AbrB/MazE/SpoVT family DNA-binding domain-containing protein, partial [Nanoarchaeota archaeon]|nr:AbrB/MazE/SpoVT family DNA-binding domain-containing protein [Nanoarchaeota archaeon]
MAERKIQLIAGTTYTVSLPKEWVKKYNLKEKSRVSIKELRDGNLSLSPSTKLEDRDKKKITLNIDNYGANIDQVLFAAYYLGFEEINLFSKNEISMDLRSLIKKALVYMSGTEIMVEDIKNIEIKVLLDLSKINANQLFFRINIILNANINHII